MPRCLERGTNSRLISWIKLLQIATETRKFVKVFTHERNSLYGTHVCVKSFILSDSGESLEYPVEAWSD